MSVPTTRMIDINNLDNLDWEDQIYLDSKIGHRVKMEELQNELDEITSPIYKLLDKITSTYHEKCCERYYKIRLEMILERMNKYMEEVQESSFWAQTNGFRWRKEKTEVEEENTELKKEIQMLKEENKKLKDLSEVRDRQLELFIKEQDRQRGSKIDKEGAR